MEKILKDFEIPSNLIASYPVNPRDHSRLLVAHKNKKTIRDLNFYDLPSLLQKDDLLILNNTKVFSARVLLEREVTKGKHECIFLNKDPNNFYWWKILINKSSRLVDGERLIIYNKLYNKKKIIFKFKRLKNNEFRLEEPFPLSLKDFESFGSMPIPPYLKRFSEFSDKENYQSIFAKNYGSAASPTASLHFTHELFNKIKNKKIRFEEVTLNIGYGTFAPLQKKNFKDKQLHSEYYLIPQETANALKRKEYSRLVVVGTTALRVLETVHRKTQGQFNHSLMGETDLFLFPPEQIKTANILITNFHLPNSSLAYLMGCMVPIPFLKQIYQHALQKKYRFLSYGDAMIVL